MPDLPLLLFAFTAIAALYGSVGHGGASGYLAIMALSSFAPESLRPTALVLNLAVSSLATVLFFRAGHFNARLFWPFVVTSIPCAFLGGHLSLPTPVFKWMLAAALAFAAVRLVLPARKLPVAGNASDPSASAPLTWMLLTGAVIGLVSGLIGVGGGIFLTPLLLLMRWSNAQTAAAVSAPFILVNSMAGLAGQTGSLHHLPSGLPWLVLGVVVGGYAGAHWGSARAHAARLRPVLAAVLGVACIKLLLP